MVIKNTLIIGSHAEQLGLKYILNKNKNLKILQKNFRCKLGELDLILYDTSQKLLIIVEIRCHQRDFFISPPETVNFSKQQKIINTTRYFGLKNPGLNNYNIRFDILGIIGNLSKPETLKYNWLKNAFQL